VPNRPSWQPTRPPEDLPEDSPDDLIQNDLMTWRTRQDIGGFRPKADRQDMARVVINKTYVSLLLPIWTPLH
jgi:hypothetical protein